MIFDVSKIRPCGGLLCDARLEASAACEDDQCEPAQPHNPSEELSSLHIHPHPHTLWQPSAPSSPSRSVSADRGYLLRLHRYIRLPRVSLSPSFTIDVDILIVIVSPRGVLSCMFKVYRVGLRFLGRLSMDFHWIHMLSKACMSSRSALKRDLQSRKTLLY